MGGMAWGSSGAKRLWNMTGSWRLAYPSRHAERSRGGISEQGTALVPSSTRKAFLGTVGKSSPVSQNTRARVIRFRASISNWKMRWLMIMAMAGTMVPYLHARVLVPVQVEEAEIVNGLITHAFYSIPFYCTHRSLSLLRTNCSAMMQEKVLPTIDPPVGSSNSPPV